LSFPFGVTRRETETQRFSGGGVGGLKNPLRCPALHIVSYAPQSVSSGRPGPVASQQEETKTGFHSVNLATNNWKTIGLFCFYLLFSVSTTVFHFSNTKGSTVKHIFGGKPLMDALWKFRLCR